MATLPTPTRYPKTLIALHWLTLLLIVAVYVLIEFRDIYPKGTPGRDAMKYWHFVLGLTIFALTFVRLVARARVTMPMISPPPPGWMDTLGRAAHFVLYAFLIGMPFLGWLTLSAKGAVIPFWGLELPSLLEVDKAVAKQLEEIHATVGTVGYALIGLHASAALLHHFMMRDNTLRRMLPGRE
ncbi:cytochrome b [Sinimarinibacterium sp. NLF-5-8]|nr:cytochrome b [Sinimarinibacterium sp. NLF-5-8]